MFLGSHVSSGVGKGVIYATGVNTVFGDLAKNITDSSKKPVLMSASKSLSG